VKRSVDRKSTIRKYRENRKTKRAKKERKEVSVKKDLKK